MELLLENQMPVGGKWLPADSGKTLAVINPASGEELGRAPLGGADETRRAISAAAEAFPLWKNETAKSRAAILQKWAQLILQNQESLARLMTAEQGKPLAEARGEVSYAADFAQWFGEEAKRIFGETLPAPKPGARLAVWREAAGVAAMITPWNFPLAMIVRKAAPAFAAGCTAVVKPSELTPFTALAAAKLAEEAGLPPGVLNVVMGDAPSIGKAMCESEAVRALSFTGSTKVGKLLMSQCAGTVKKVGLELGGNAPFIVFADADLHLAAQCALASKFRNSGQTCVCANRIFVQEEVYDEFLSLFRAEVERLRVGDGAKEGTTQGPLITAAAVEKVERHIADAVDKGAKILTGGGRHEAGAQFFTPTILTDVRDDVLPCCEETFGPVAPVLKFKDEDEVVARANATRQGLAAYFCSRDYARIFRVAESLEAGMVGVNEGVISSAAAPFGGVKESGLGREGGSYGIEEFLEIKYVHLGGG